MANENVSKLSSFASHAARANEHNPVISRLKEDPDVQLGMAAARVRMSFAQLAREMRRRAGLTQAEVAALLDTTQKQISRMESCTANAGDITVGMFAKFMQVCGVDLVVEVPEASARLPDRKPVVKVQGRKHRAKVVDLADLEASA